MKLLQHQPVLAQFLSHRRHAVLLTAAAAAAAAAILLLQVSTVIGAAVPSEREQNAWSEGVAIWVAVFIVSGVGGSGRWLSAGHSGATRAAVCTSVLRSA